MTRILQRVCFVFLIISISAHAALTVHINNPWRSDGAFEAPLRIFGGAGTGWDAGSAKVMTDEGGGWYSWTYPGTTTKATVENISVTFFKDGTSWSNPSTAIWNIPSLFAGSLEGQIDVWIETTPGGGYLSHYFKAMDSIVVNLLNPFPATSPKMLFQGTGSPEQMVAMGGVYDGWYSKKLYFYTDETDVTVKFKDYFETEWYTSIGRGDGPGIDINGYRNDTVWIYPQPYPYGPGTTTDTYPTGVVGASTTRDLTALVRDWNQADDSFEEGFANDPIIKNLVANSLDASGKLQLGSAASYANFRTDDIPTWFETVTTPLGNENDTCIELELKKGDDGSWEYRADASTGGFFPIDAFDPWGDGLYNGHNFSFTMELHTQFEYYAGQGQIFEFTGDDDVWVFVNGNLAVDIGGPHPPLSGSVNLDAVAGSYGLVDGETYNLDMFYCERECWEPGPNQSANFYMKVNFDLRTNFTLLYDKASAGTEDVYTIEQLTPSGSLTDDVCGYNVYDTAFDTTTAMVAFTLEGPSVTPAQVITTGTHYGGIRVIGGAGGDSAIAIDTTKMAGLAAGIYTIRYASVLDPTQTGFFTFEVIKSLSALNIVADPNSGTSFWRDASIILRVIRDGLDTVSSLTNDSINLYYTVNAIMPDSTNLSAATLYTGPVAISADATLRVLAIGTDMIADTATFSYTRSYTTGQLIANPGDGTSFVGDTAVELLFVVGSDTLNPLTVDSIDVWWTQNSATPIIGDSSQLYSSTIVLTGSDTIRAIISGASIIADTGLFIYTRDYLPTEIVADPISGTSFIGDTIINLSVLVFGDTLNPLATDTITVWWSLSGYPDTTDSATIYTAPIVVSSSSTVYAIVSGTNIDTDSAQFAYTRDYYDTQIWAIPDSGTHFGEELSVQILTDADELYYIIGDIIPDTSDASQRYTGAIDLSVSASDTVIVTAVAFGENYHYTAKKFIYYRDYAPAVLANPADTTFVDSIVIGLTTEATTLSNISIYYTLDGSVPTDSTGILYVDSIVLDTTMTVTARAYADSSRAGVVTDWTYRRIFAASGGLFYDRDRNGLIDEVVLTIQGTPAATPSEVVVVNPLSNRDTVTVSSGDITLVGSTITVALTTEPFEATSTDIGVGAYVQIIDTAYTESWVAIEDGVAPVVVAADYYYGDGLAGTRIDTLEVVLSEDFHPASLSTEPFLLWDISGAPVTLELAQEQPVSGDVVRLLVISIERNISRDDSISINPKEGIVDLLGNGQDADNIRRPITIYPSPIKLKLSTLSPFVPQVTEIPSELQMDIEKGTAIIADFQSDLSVVDIDIDLEYDLVILDALGNMLGAMHGKVEDAVASGISAIEQHPSDRPNVNMGIITAGGSTQLVITWNGVNRHGREVSTGIYAVFMSIRLKANGVVLAEYNEAQSYLGVKSSQ